MPLRAEYIACVNLNTMEIKYIDIPNREQSGLDAFVEGIKYGKDLVFAPRYLHAFVRIDTELKTATELYRSDISMDQWSRGIILDRDILHVTNLDGEIGMDIDLNTGHCKNLKSSVGMGGYYSSVGVDREAWMIPYDTNELVIEDLDSRERRTINTGSGFYRGWLLDNGTILLPAKKDVCFTRIQKKDSQIIQLKNVGTYVPIGSWSEINVVDTDDGSYIGGSSDGMIVQYFKEEDMIHTYQAVIDEDQLIDSIISKYKSIGLFDDTMHNNEVLKEGFGFTLSGFLEMV